MKRTSIFVIAASAERRAKLRKLLSTAWSSADIAMGSAFSPERIQDSATQVLVADLESLPQAGALLRFLSNAPPIYPAVALVDDPERHWVRQALVLGVNAIVARDSSSEDLRLAIEAAMGGFVLLHPSSADHLIGPLELAIDLEQGDLAVEDLTAREREVLLLMSSGLGNRDIAARLGISEHTAKFHASSILGKLGASSRTEAVSLGIRRGLITI